MASKHYVNNRRFYEEIVRYRQKKEDFANGLIAKEPKIPDYVGLCILQIANRLATKPNFSSYSFKEEMIGDGIENCFRYFDSFDPNKTENPFAYFTQVIKFAFIRRILKEEKDRYVKYKNLIRTFGSEATLTEGMNEFIKRFEDREFKKKNKGNDDEPTTTSD